MNSEPPQLKLGTQENLPILDLASQRFKIIDSLFGSVEWSQFPGVGRKWHSLRLEINFYFWRLFTWLNSWSWRESVFILLFQTAVWPDWGIYERYLLQIYLQKFPKYLATFWASLKHGTFKVKPVVAAF